MACQPTQKQVPEQSFNACVELFEVIDKYLRENKGQITSCSQEWQAFQRMRIPDDENETSFPRPPTRNLLGEYLVLTARAYRPTIHFEVG